MSDLSSLEASLKKQPKKPPIHLWQPELSGDIDIVIKSNGDWEHEGGRIKRHTLIKLFASILRREQDGDYYLVTPVEKWRIQVEDHPLLVIDADVCEPGSDQQSVRVKSNIDDEWLVSEPYPIALPDNTSPQEPVPYVVLDNGLTAKFNRAVFYRLTDYFAEREEGFYLLSEGCWFKVG